MTADRWQRWFDKLLLQAASLELTFVKHIRLCEMPMEISSNFAAVGHDHLLPGCGVVQNAAKIYCRSIILQVGEADLPNKLQISLAGIGINDSNLAP